MLFSSWSPKRRIEQQYLTALQKLKALILRLFGDDLTKIEDLPDKLHALSASKPLYDWARMASRTMVTNTLSETAKTWRQAAKEQGRGRQMYAAQQRMLEGHLGARVDEIIDRNAMYIHTVPSAVAKDLTKFMASQTYADSRQAYKLPQFREMVGEMTEKHAKLIARTETSKAHAAINQAQAEELGLDWYIWHATGGAQGDGRTRDSHKHMDNVLCRYSDPPAPEKLLGKKSEGNYSAGNIYNCFPASTEVALSKGYNRIWRRLYDGKLIRTVLADGTAFEATPKHPVLTLNGWTAVDALQCGDYLVYAEPNESEIGEDKVDGLVTCFADLFETARVRYGSKAVSGGLFNIHGERVDGEVDEIVINAFLSDDGKALGLESVGELPLTCADSRVTALSVIGRGDHVVEPLFSGGANQVSPLAEVKRGHSESVGLREASRCNTITSENVPNGLTTTAQTLGQREDALALSVSRKNVSLVEDEPVSRGVPTDRNGKPATAEAIADYCAMMPDSLRGGLKCGAVSYKLLRVVNKSTRDFSGHVYNLQSDYGYYSITQRGVIVKNCRCYASEVILWRTIKWPMQVHDHGVITKMGQRDFMTKYGRTIKEI